MAESVIIFVFFSPLWNTAREGITF